MRLRECEKRREPSALGGEEDPTLTLSRGGRLGCWTPEVCARVVGVTQIGCSPLGDGRSLWMIRESYRFSSVVFSTWSRDLFFFFEEKRRIPDFSKQLDELDRMSWQTGPRLTIQCQKMFIRTLFNVPRSLRPDYQWKTLFKKFSIGEMRFLLYPPCARLRGMTYIFSEEWSPK